MKKKDTQRLSDIRRQAEALVERRPAGEPSDSPEEKDRLIYELHVHQIELEIQNEELRQAQLELEDSRNKYADLYDFAPIGYLTLDHQGFIIQGNLKASELLGLNRLRLTGHLLSNFILKEDRDQYYGHQRRAIATGLLSQCDLRLQPKKGPLRHIQLQTLSEGNNHGQPPHYRTAMIDITERKEAEGKLYESQNALREEARRKDEFLAMLAHELRNPLAPIRNASHLLQALSAGDARLCRLQELIERQVGNMARLLDDLLDVSRITRGKIQLRLRTLDLREVVDSAVETCEATLMARDHELFYDRSEEPVWVVGDPTRLEQVVSNLLYNAIKYTEPCGKIWLSVNREGLIREPGNQGAVVRVRDNGIGIAPEVLPHIFDLFTQAERTLDRAQGGLGIGLTLVRNLVELHDGQICAHSAGLGHGSEFSMMLPLAEAPEEELAQASAAARDRSDRAAVDKEEKTSRPFRVLVVDDVEDNARSLAELLAGWGHQTMLAFDGPAALREAARFQPEIVLLDIGLPGADGYEVARQLRQRTQGDRMLLIALTGYGREDDVRRAHAAGFNRHLTKPVNLETLQGILHQFVAGQLASEEFHP